MELIFFPVNRLVLPREHSTPHPVSSLVLFGVSHAFYIPSQLGCFLMAVEKPMYGMEALLILFKKRLCYNDRNIRCVMLLNPGRFTDPGRRLRISYSCLEWNAGHNALFKLFMYYKMLSRVIYSPIQCPH